MSEHQLTGHNITDISIYTRHVLMFRLMTLIGQSASGTRTDSIYLEPYISEGLQLTERELQLVVRVSRHFGSMESRDWIMNSSKALVF